MLFNLLPAASFVENYLDFIEILPKGIDEFCVVHRRQIHLVRFCKTDILFAEDLVASGGEGAALQGFQQSSLSLLIFFNSYQLGLEIQCEREKEYGHYGEKAA